MSFLIVVTGLDQLPTTERWPRFVAPLAEELASSGLGNLPELDSLRREVDECGSLQATEVATNLVNLGYGYWDEPGQYWYIWSADQVYEDGERQFLVIGGPGVDGIDWGYRRGQSGLWAWYPIDAEFVALAPTTEALLQGWLSGAITV